MNLLGFGLGNDIAVAPTHGRQAQSPAEYLADPTRSDREVEVLAMTLSEQLGDLAHARPVARLGMKVPDDLKNLSGDVCRPVRNDLGVVRVREPEDVGAGEVLAPARSPATSTASSKCGKADSQM